MVSNCFCSCCCCFQMHTHLVHCVHCSCLFWCHKAEATAAAATLSSSFFPKKPELQQNNTKPHFIVDATAAVWLRPSLRPSRCLWQPPCAAAAASLLSVLRPPTTAHHLQGAAARQGACKQWSWFWLTDYLLHSCNLCRAVLLLLLLLAVPTPTPTLRGSLVLPYRSPHTVHCPDTALPLQ
jgi:hypothetical protein